MAEYLDFRLKKSDYTINEEWMTEMYMNIKTGKITLKQAAKEVPIHHKFLC